MIAMFFSFLGMVLLLLMVGSGALLLLLLVVTITSRRRGSCDTGSRRGDGPRWWPVLLATPLIFLLYLLSGIRIEKSVGPTGAHAPHVAEAQQRIARQQARISHRMAEAHAEMVHHRIARMDIHELMDKADAPRIALPPDPPPPPESPEPIAPSGEASGSNEQPRAEPAEDADAARDSSAVSEDDEVQKTDNGSEAEKPEVGEVPPEKLRKSAEEAERAEHAESAEEAPAAEEAKDAEQAPAAEEAAPAAQAKDADREGGKQLTIAVNAPVAALRPAWVDAASKRVGNTWRNVLVTDEFATKPECDREADRLLADATLEHLRLLGGGGETIWDDGLGIISEQEQSAAAQLASMGISIDYIRREIAKDEHLETVERSFGPMTKLYTLVEFTPAVDRELRARWEDHRRQERFAVVGGGAASVLALLGVAWGLLRLDTMTKGYYTKRLFLGVPAAIIGGILGLIVWYEVIF